MLDDGATGLLGAKATGDILATLPGAGVDQPAFGIPAMVQPPAQIGCRFRVEATQPVQVTCPAHDVVATPHRKTPLGSGAAYLPVIGDHIVAAILAHTGQIGMWR